MMLQVTLTRPETEDEFDEDDRALVESAFESDTDEMDWDDREVSFAYEADESLDFGMLGKVLSDLSEPLGVTFAITNDHPDND